MSKVTEQDIAKMIDHSLLYPTMDDQTLKVRKLGVTRIGATTTEAILLAIRGRSAAGIS
ncbi:MAG: hypothetical protein V3V53_09975 [Bacteroidales bacterium]|jgi:hypothetical protein